MYQYKNVSEVQQTITAEGDISPRIVEPGETTDSSVEIENPNFELVGSAEVPPVVEAPAEQEPVEEGE